MSDDQPPAALGLAPITLDDKAHFHQTLRTLAQPISDYSFANVFIWNTALRLYAARLHRHLCVFANGTGDLTLLLPPLPEPGAAGDDLRRSLAAAFDIMDAYNRRTAEVSRSRIEYVSDEMLERIHAMDRLGIELSATPMSGDYIYPRQNMVELSGGALKSKRHARGKFIRDYPDHHTQPLDQEHVPACLALLEHWQQAGDAQHVGQMSEEDAHMATSELRRRETLACQLALKHHRELDLRGMVLFNGDQLIGFTLGEALSPAQASILIEKTHPDCHGAPQFIFSEFCRRDWPDHPEINVGDDWGIPTLRFTKESYRPSRRLSKYLLARPPVAPRLIVPAADARSTDLDAPLPPIPAGDRVTLDAASAVTVRPPLVRPARPADVSVLTAIEARCFLAEDAFGRRHVRDLIHNDHVLCRVAEQDGTPAGWGIALVRQHRQHRSGRLYNLAVDPAYRGRGIGSLLLRHLLDELHQRGVQHVYLEVRTDNLHAIQLYESLGFRTVRRLPDYYGRTIHGLSMKRTMPTPPGGASVSFEPNPAEAKQRRVMA